MAAVSHALITLGHVCLSIVIDENANGVNRDSLTLYDGLNCSGGAFSRQSNRACKIVRLTSRNQTHRETLLIRASEHTIDHLIECSIATDSNKSTVIVDFEFLDDSEWVKLLLALQDFISDVLLVEQATDLFMTVA